MGTILSIVPPSFRYSCAEESSLKWSADVEWFGLSEVDLLSCDGVKIGARYVGPSGAARVVCHDADQSVLDVIPLVNTIES